jgi:MerR family copper efflux transcriptional regulator
MTETTSTPVPIACALTADELTDRVAQLRVLGERLEAVEAQGARATLRFGGDRVPVDQFVESEQRCCAFFEFEVAAEGDGTRLEIGAPPGAEPFVRSIVAAMVRGWDGALG